MMNRFAEPPLISSGAENSILRLSDWPLRYDWENIHQNSFTRSS